MSDQKYLDDKQMVVRLHDVARLLEDADNLAGQEMRAIADRLSELVENAATRRHWCNGRE